MTATVLFFFCVIMGLITEADLIDPTDPQAVAPPPTSAVETPDAFEMDWQRQARLDEEDEEDEPEAIPDPVAVTPAATPVAVAPPATPQPTNVNSPPARPPEATLQQPSNEPQEFDGWYVSADGTALENPAMDDINSPDAIDLREQIGDIAYTQLLNEYGAAKIQFNQHVEATENAAIATGTQTIAAEIEARGTWLRTTITTAIPTIPEATLAEIAADVDKETRGALVQARDQTMQQMMSSGIPQHVADRRARAMILSDPGVYEHAQRLTLGFQFENILVKILGAGNNGVPAPVAGAVRQAAPGNAPVPSPPALGTGAGVRAGGGAPEAPTVRLSAQQKEIGKALGYDEADYAQRIGAMRRLR